MKKLIATVMTTGLALTLAACGSEAETEEKPQDDVATDQSTEAAPADSGSEDTSAEVKTDDVSVGGGSYRATLDGAEFTVEDETIVCAEQGSTMTIAIGSASADASDVSGISMTIREDGTVDAVALGTTSGDSLVYAPDAGVGSATAEIDGDTYTVTGEGISSNMDDPAAGGLDPVPFEVEVTCG